MSMWLLGTFSGIFGTTFPDLQCLFKVGLDGVSSLILAFGIATTVASLLFPILNKKCNIYLLMATMIVLFCTGVAVIAVTHFIEVAFVAIAVAVFASGAAYTATSFTISYAPEISLQQLIAAVTKESSPIVVYDASCDCPTLQLHITDYSYPYLMYEYKHFYSYIRHHMMSLLEYGTLTDFRRHLNFLLICGNESTGNLMREVTELDNTIGQGSLLRHFSTWLIISHDPPPRLNITLDNLALIQVSQLRPQMETYLPRRIQANLQRYNGYLEKLSRSFVKEVYTLLWIPGRRDWSHVQPRDVSHDDLYNIIYPNTKRGLNGRKLRLSTVEFSIFTIRSSNTRGVTYTGAGIDGVDVLARKFNFSYVIVEPEDMLWGQIRENGSSTGVIGMLQRAEADMCPVPYVISQRRLEVMDITSPFTGTEYKVLYKRLKMDTNSGRIHLPWFSWQVYLCGFASLLWMALLFSCITSQRRMKTISSRKRNMSSCLEIGIHIPLRQSILKLPESTSEMIIIWTWCIFCLVVTAVYAGNLVASATVDKYNPPFTTLQELAEDNEYTVGVAEGGYAESILMTSDDPILKSIYQKVTKSMMGSKYNSSKHLLAENIHRLLNDKYVLISPGTVSNSIISNTCDVVDMKEKFAEVHSGYAFPRNSPLKKLFEKQVMILAEVGVFAKIEEEWSHKPLDCDSSVPKVLQVNISSMKKMLVICSPCIVLAAIVLLVEMRKKKYCP